MTGSEGSRVHRHPDAVAYLEGLGEEGATVVRPHGGGHTRYWGLSQQRSQTLMIGSGRSPRAVM